MTTITNAATLGANLDTIASNHPSTTNSDVRELTDTEIDAIAGGLDPLSVLVGGAIAGGCVIITIAAIKWLCS